MDFLFLKKELDTLGIENSGENTSNNIFINLNNVNFTNYIIKSLETKNIFVRGGWPHPYDRGFSVTGGPKYLMEKFLIAFKLFFLSYDKKS